MIAAIASAVQICHKSMKFDTIYFEFLIKSRTILRPITPLVLETARV